MGKFGSRKPRVGLRSEAEPKGAGDCLPHLPLRRVMVQFFLTAEGTLGSSKTKGPTLGSMSASAAVMLMTFRLGFSQICASLGSSSGALSLMSIR